LSPAFDLNPVPTDIKPRLLATSIDVDGDPTASLEGAMQVARQFGLSASAASGIAGEVRAAVATWRKEGAKHGLRAAECDRMASAFELAV
jgi:serine/threonine-protein kinase HipA